MINNPVSYYEAVGFTSVDSLVYSASLIGAVGGIGGIIQGIRFKDTSQILTFSLMLLGCGAGAWQGLRIANMNY
jgi:hypothetical protein